MNISRSDFIIFPWKYYTDKLINPFAPHNISMDKLSGNIQIINPETPLFVRFRPIIFPWKYRNNISVDNISAHFLQMNRTQGAKFFYAKPKNGRFGPLEGSNEENKATLFM